MMPDVPLSNAAPAPARVAYIHAGTHKTGTTSIQAFLAANERRLAAAGVYLPTTGRTNREVAAQPNVAWELTGDWSFDPRYGTFDEMLAEIAGSGQPTVCISSEEFDRLHLYPNALARFAAGFRSIGYAPKLIVYLRPQCEYAASLYAELVRGGHRISFADFIDDIAGVGATYGPLFDYLALLDGFASVFGDSAIIARAYDANATPDALLRSFASLIGGNDPELDPAHLRLPDRLNVRQTFASVARAFGGGDADGTFHDRSFGAAFDPLTLADIVRICRRFRRANERIEQRYAARVHTVSAVQLRRGLSSMLGFGHGAQQRKRWYRHFRSLAPTGTFAAPSAASDKALLRVE